MAVKHLALLVLINLCWGFNFIAGKWGTEEFGSLTFSAVRFAIVLVLLFPFLRWVPGQMGCILLIGFLLGACHYSIMFLAMFMTENISAVAVAARNWLCLSQPSLPLCFSVNGSVLREQWL